MAQEGALMSDQFVIMTRYQKTPTTVIRHVYGPYPTRAKALGVVRQMRRNSSVLFGMTEAQIETKIEVHVTKLLS
jgi:hypothetical protein